MTGVRRVAIVGTAWAHEAFIRGVIVNNFLVVKDLLRYSVARFTQPENLTRNLATHVV
jgi:hypothetical protein